MRNKLFLSFLVFSLLCPIKATAELADWPYLYETSIVPDLNVKLRQSDWNTILADDTFDIEVPALFWAGEDGAESAILVSIRRKSATPFNGKVSFKIDINEYDGDDPRAVGSWHNIKKLSLENGDDVDLVSEGLAWYIHKLAGNVGVYPSGHQVGLANWATLTAHLAADCVVEPCDFFDIGDTVSILDPMIYLNVEQPDKQYLKNRGQWFSGETWLYKQDEHGFPPEIKEAGCEPEVDDSPAVIALNCAPFIPGTGDTQDNTGTLVCDLALVDDLIDMPVMLAQAAADAFAGNPDGVFTHVKNFYAVDYSSNGDCAALPNETDVLERQKRLHYTWDLDEAFANKNQNIYGKVRKHRGKTVLRQNGYEKQLLVDDAAKDIFFRTLYNTNILALTEPAVIQQAHQFLTDMEEILTPLLLADPNSKISNPLGHFEGLRSYLSSRAEIIRGQVCADDPSLSGCN